MTNLLKVKTNHGKQDILREQLGKNNIETERAYQVENKNQSSCGIYEYFSKATINYEKNCGKR